MAERYHRTGTPTDLTTLPTVPKALGAVHINAKQAAELSLTDRRLFNTLLAHAYEEIHLDKEHVIPLADLRDLATRNDGAKPHTVNDRLKVSVRRLNGVQIEFDVFKADGKKGWGVTTLITEAYAEDGDGLLKYRFASRLRPLLVDPAIHSRIQLFVTYQFTSKYALILYESLQRDADRRAPKWSWHVEVEELRALLCVGDKMADFKDLRRRAIEPAVGEINAHAGFTVTVTEDRLPGARGRVRAVIFTVQRKPQDEALATAKLNERTKTEKRALRGKLAVTDQTDLAASVTALRWLEDQDTFIRQKWADRAEASGIKLPVPPAAKENLPKWVPFVADAICREERLLPGGATS